MESLLVPTEENDDDRRSRNVVHENGSARNIQVSTISSSN